MCGGGGGGRGAEGSKGGGDTCVRASMRTCVCVCVVADLNNIYLSFHLFKKENKYQQKL